ncbi:hypothetical protein [Planctopirus hydrillae]|uniref:Uncharacterized protein n=1 Tax=Planctopirus hydrillae TaxID=1841610 RepID=A0A1C3ETI7_9PLAN|nr:hypothetical protein [Planctopirus hydrillae]ODA36495.1 hypothetical protein A6X21_02085 [Planctopirus hydrillae]
MTQEHNLATVCLIDDERHDYQPFLDALSHLGIQAVHVRGTDLETTPRQHFRNVRLVFTDLHLGNYGSEKTHASHTASVFLKTISPEHGPLRVVVWSKYADQRVPLSEFASPPEDDQPDLADLFINEVTSTDHRFKEIAQFSRMSKPLRADRPSFGWGNQLENEILRFLPHFRLLQQSRVLIRSQLGQGDIWMAITEAIFGVMCARNDESFLLSDAVDVASSVSCDILEVIAVLSQLTKPSSAVLRFVFESSLTGNDVTTEEFSRTLASWWRRNEMSDEQWSRWSESVIIKWLFADTKSAGGEDE